MEAALYPQEQKPIPWQLIGRVALTVFAIGAIVGGLLFRSHALSRASAFETLADIHLVRTGLEQYFLVRSAYPSPRAASVPLGVGEALCLDDSTAGFQFSCTGQLLIPVLPSGVDGSPYRYSRSESGYRLEFVLPQAVAAWTDTNDDGRVVCVATESAVSCE